MADLTLQRGAIPVDLDRPRILFFDMAATWLLIQRYGPKFLLELYRVKDDSVLELASMDALAYFLFAGLQADAEAHGETLSPKQAQDFLRPWNYRAIFESVVYAVVGATSTPAQPGKAPADGVAAGPAVAPAAAPSPGPTKVSTAMKRSASRTRSSAGAKRSSGKRR